MFRLLSQSINKCRNIYMVKEREGVSNNKLYLQNKGRSLFELFF